MVELSNIDEQQIRDNAVDIVEALFREKVVDNHEYSRAFEIIYDVLKKNKENE